MDYQEKKCRKLRKKRVLDSEENSVQLQIPLLENLMQDNERLRLENLNLQKENAALKEELKKSATKLPTAPIAAEPLANYQIEKTPNSKLNEATTKLSLFRSLFRGREDVYAERWQKKDGTSNYSPAKIHDWDLHKRNEKGKSQCADSCKLLSLTDQIIKDHLTGQRTIGIYPLLKDDTCWFLAVDFDKIEWNEDAIAFLDTCDTLGVPAYLERSRSGNGAHVWIFFNSPVPAAQARALGTYLVSQTKEKRYQLGFKSYDRLFPNQDTMPRGGFGNLIALPLQKEPSQCGNSVFIDRDLMPIEDQWSYLRSIIRFQQKDLEAIVREAFARNAVIPVSITDDENAEDDELELKPWKRKPTVAKENILLKEPFPKSLQIVLGDMIYVPKHEFSSQALNKIMGIAAFQNPEFYQKQATRQSTYDTPRVICCADDLPKFIALPRGCLDKLQTICRENEIDLKVQDERISGSELDLNFKGELREEQKAAEHQLLAFDNGILSASTAFGKTVVAISVLAKRKVNTLILVHRAPLIDQWKDRLEQFLVYPKNAIGQTGGGKKKRTGLIDIATIQSMGRNDSISDHIAEYGQIIVDECHHLPAFTFEQVIKRAKAKYFLGLTATPTRKDGHQPIIMMQCGPIRCRDSSRNRKSVSGVSHSVITRETGIHPPISEDGVNIHALYDALAQDESRNNLIFDDILNELELGRSPLVITERVEHLDFFARKLQGFAKNIIVLKGGMSKKERLKNFANLKSIPDDSERIILSTGKYIGEGFDDARLDTLFLLLPISFEGRVEQYAGRLHRQHEGKTQIKIYDYVDSNHPVLKKMFERRCAKYRKLGYEIQSHQR